ncbi:MAG: Flp family type IVb pilin [Planctomycetia bacterium]|nr:Flp family type IVb pilin [Planctomycetia bacterium]
MHKLVKKIQSFIRSEDGPTAVEYAVMLALIVVVCLTTIRTLGTNANTTFSKVSTSLTSAS